MDTEADDHFLDRDAIGEWRLDAGIALASPMQVEIGYPYGSKLVRPSLYNMVLSSRSGSSRVFAAVRGTEQPPLQAPSSGVHEPITCKESFLSYTSGGLEVAQHLALVQ